MSITENSNYPFRDTTLTLAERVNDLISQMTLEEKVTQLQHTSQAIPRLDIPEYDWWNECLHGVGRAGAATVFPQSIGLAATFDRELLFKIGSAISDEARGKYNAAQKIGNRMRYMGLTFWSPNINIFRDPRWGRGQETYGEDPHLTAVLGTAYIRGLQGDHPHYLKAAACAKHFAVHSGPEKHRHSFNAEVNAKDLYETYLPAFKALVDAGVEIVMGAYNRTNGEPCCGSEFLLVELLRKKWKFGGHVVSDCWAIQDFHKNHKITSTPEESIALALKTGCDLNCGCVYESHYLLNALKKGFISEDDINTALTNVFRTRFRLGMFDPPAENPFAQIGEEVVDCPAHRQLAYEAAVKSVVLLQNKDNLLPLKKDLKAVYVFGSNAVDIELLMGNYNGYNGRMVTILEGITEKVNRGTTIMYKRAHLPSQAAEVDQGFMQEIKKADVFIVVLGITPQHEGEEGSDAVETGGEGDRRSIALPESQVQFLKELHTLNIPTIVVLTAGSQLDISSVMQESDAILYVWYPGEEGGTAIADIIFGDVSPSGRLPLTFPKSLDQLPDFSDYAMANRTYRYMKEEPLLPFGFGLSYTHFTYTDLKLSATEISAGEELIASINIENSGSCPGDEVIQLYLTHNDLGEESPLYSLKAFSRIHLTPGSRQEIRFTLKQEDLEVVNAKGENVLTPGRVTIYIGGSLPDKRSRELGATPLLNADFNIR